MGNSPRAAPARHRPTSHGSGAVPAQNAERLETLSTRGRFGLLAGLALLLAASGTGTVIAHDQSLAHLVDPARLAPSMAAGVLGLALLVPATARRRLLFWPMATAGTGLAAGSGWLALALPPVRTSEDVTRDMVIVAASLSLLIALLIKRLIDELRHRVAQLQALAGTDQLTTLPNRRAWDEELERELARARRDGHPVCVAILDLDHFKAFNDMRGHQEGDRLLATTARAWKRELRSNDFLARYGGEEFAAAFPRCNLENSLQVVERLRAVVPDEQTCSVGLARWDGRESPAELFSRADEALYKAKVAGRNRVKCAQALFEQETGRASRTNWARIVPALVDSGAVVAAYQPIVDLASGSVVAHEALARPDRERGADISVEGMFTTAQRMGLGRELDMLCRRAALIGSGWIHPQIPLFINVNLSTLLDPAHRVDQMLRLADEAGARSPQSIVLEITEREVFSDLTRLRLVVSAYRQRGFRFAIDDVGEGHSTLEVLAAVAPEYIKIARSLVVEARNVGPRAAIAAVVAFARITGASVIAEGIENEGSASYVAACGVNLGQGWHFGRPRIPAVATTLAGAAAEPPEPAEPYRVSSRAGADLPQPA